MERYASSISPSLVSASAPLPLRGRHEAACAPTRVRGYAAWNGRIGSPSEPVPGGPDGRPELSVLLVREHVAARSRMRPSSGVSRRPTRRRQPFDLPSSRMLSPVHGSGGSTVSAFSAPPSRRARRRVWDSTKRRVRRGDVARRMGADTIGVKPRPALAESIRACAQPASHASMRWRSDRKAGLVDALPVRPQREAVTATVDRRCSPAGATVEPSFAP